MSAKLKSLENPVPTHQQITALVKQLATAERTFRALGAGGNIDEEKHVALLRKSKEVLKQIENAQVQTELARKETESRFKSVWEKSADGMRLTDENGTIVAVNQAFYKMVGMKREDLEGKPMTATYSEKENLDKIFQKHQQRFKERSVKRLIERKLIFRSGRTAILEVANAFLEGEGEKPLLLSVFRDLTEKKRLEAQVQQTQKMDSIGRLASGIAHDYKEVLTAIQSNASLLQSGKVNMLQLTDAARQISTAADRAAHLSRQLLLFSRRHIIQTRTIDVTDVIRNISKVLPRLLPENITMQVQSQETIPLIEADPEMIEQVLTNLVIHARDAMPTGGRLTVATSACQIDDAYVQQNLESYPGNFVCLSIGDTGSGIAPEHLPYIFEPFFSSKEGGEGLGLNLAIVYGVIRQHKGWITATSESERGTTFQIYLPVSTKKVKSEDPKPVDKKPKAPTETILVVEDEPLLLELTKHFLESHGYKVFQAASGVEAAEVWNANKDKIDLLFTDIVMPGGINGRQLAEKLHVDRPDLKVVYTSGYSAGILGKNFVLQEGINFLQKPYHRRQLVKMIRDALDAKK